jgi:hypothetical protein
MPWDETGGLVVEPSDGSGLSRFLAKHRPCDGGVDVARLSDPDGSMIRVTCTHCGKAVEAPASSWEGWSEEQAFEPGVRRRRFEPRIESRRRHVPPPRQEPASASVRAPRWRLVLAVLVVVAWTACGLLLIGSALAR